MRRSTTKFAMLAFWDASSPGDLSDGIKLLVQRCKICDQVGALRVVLQARVDHGRVRYHRPRIGEVFVERGGVPCNAELLVVGGVVEVRQTAGLSANHAEQRRAKAILSLARQHVRFL